MDTSPLLPTLTRTALEGFERWQALDGDVRFAAAAAVFGTALGVSYWREHRDGHTLTTSRLPPVGRRGLVARALLPPREPLRVGDATIDIYERHFGTVGTTGAWKTTLLAQLARQRLEAGRSVVVITGGDSDQLEAEVRAAGGWVIRPSSSPLRFNAFEGSPSYFGQSWACLFPTSSEAKVYHSAFEICATKYAEQTPLQWRSLEGLIAFTRKYQPADADGSSRLYEGMKDGYVGIRLELLRLGLGHWFGPELSVTAAVRQGVPLMFVLDSADNPDLNRFAAALVWQACNYAVRHTGGLDVFVDEVGRLPAGLIGDQVRTWRRNQSHLFVGSHTFDDFPEILGDLIGVWALGQMTARGLKTRAGAHEATWRQVPIENFGGHALGDAWYRLLLRLGRRGHFWLVDPDRVQRVSVPRYRPPALGREPQPLFPSVEGQPASGFDHGPGAATAATHKPVVEPVIGPTLRLSPPNGEMTDAKTDPPARTPRTVGARVTWGGLEPEDPPEWLHAIIGRLRAAHREGDADQLANIWSHHERVRSHRLSTYAPNNRGRPQCKYRNQPWLPYALLLALSEERPLDEVRRKMADKTANGLTVDHRCRELDPQTSEAEEYACVEIEHLVWKTRSGNTAIQWERKRLRRVS